ncbi:phosphatase [Lithospermum erythrorhizon]|uniref:Phosphatase n=1 Tax=Lithospermum erythrorhizon TaxID=34254 RepID=A0AAV3NUA2_LITER
MGDENSKKSKFSWPKSLVKKWLNIKSKADEFHADESSVRDIDEEWRNNACEKEECSIKKSKTDLPRKRNSDRIKSKKVDPDVFETTDVQNFQVFVATWNVAGKSPPNNLRLEEWLHTSPPADIYVLGFQEIVPLNAGNVLGTEDNGPAKKWLTLIRRTLNSLPGMTGGYPTQSPVPDPLVGLDADFEGNIIQRNSTLLHRHSFHSSSHSMRLMNDDMSYMPQPRLDCRFSVCERSTFTHRPSEYGADARWGGFSDDENDQAESPGSTNYSPNTYSVLDSMGEREQQSGHSRYCLVASKQMVGIFLTVWIRSGLRDDVRNLKVSCVGRGLMGYLGNKGSISMSMSLHQTSFCFVCSHLTSGEKEGDELRRNSDVMEILRKTRFPRFHGTGDDNLPETILEHDRVIWLGDLNYRIALSYRLAKALVEMRNWRALLENDQLQIEQRHGRVFEEWNEGRIYFPPTYKYSTNSDRYAGEILRPKEKRRTPAWCDRILWYGQGLNQISYVRGESKFSDHRPVYGIFLVEVECINHSRFRKSMGYSSSRIEIEELLPVLYRQREQHFY